MELNNKAILLLALAAVVILAVGAGIAIINSMDLQPGGQPGTTGNNVSNSTGTATVTPLDHPSASPSVGGTTSPVPGDLGGNPTIGVSATPTTMATASPTVTVSPVSSVNPDLSKFFSDNAFLGESGRITVQPYIFNTQGEADSKGFKDLIMPGSLPEMNIRVLLLRFDSSPSGPMYQTIDIPDNPLSSPNCLAYGNPAFTFTDLPSAGYTIWLEYEGRVWPNEFMFVNSNGQWGAIFSSLDKGKVIPGNVASGTVYGYVKEYVKDNGYVPVSGANVTLYSCVIGGSSMPYVNTVMVNVTSNPQLSEAGDEGLFRFDGLAPGLYNVTAEKNGLSAYYNVDLKQNWNGMTADPTNGKYITITLQ